MPPGVVPYTDVEALVLVLVLGIMVMLDDIVAKRFEDVDGRVGECNCEFGLGWQVKSWEQRKRDECVQKGEREEQ